MTRPRHLVRSLSLSATAAATLLCVAAPVFAQDGTSPPPPPPPPSSNVPPPMQAMAAPKGLEDMTGSLGFGVGVAAGAQTLIAPVDVVAVKYWMNDALAVVPSLSFNVTKPAGGVGPASQTVWNFNPSAIVLFVPFRSTTTRLSVGGGLGIGLGKNPPVSPNTRVQIFIPIQAGVEHFFTRWFSMGIAAQSNLVDYQKDVHFASTIDSTLFLGQLFFYTD